MNRDPEKLDARFPWLWDQARVVQESKRLAGWGSGLGKGEKRRLQVPGGPGGRSSKELQYIVCTMALALHANSYRWAGMCGDGTEGYRGVHCKYTV